MLLLNYTKNIITFQFFSCKRIKNVVLYQKSINKRRKKNSRQEKNRNSILAKLYIKIKEN